MGPLARAQGASQYAGPWPDVAGSQTTLAGIVRPRPPNFSHTGRPGQTVQTREPAPLPRPLLALPPLLPPFAISGSAASGEMPVGPVRLSLHAATPNASRATTVVLRTNLDTSMTFSLVMTGVTRRPPCIPRSRSSCAGPPS